jgi:aspartyl-tRNA(Asn)/glutamyl-tRNA(Gln) amidotransferase subunit C
MPARSRGLRQSWDNNRIPRLFYVCTALSGANSPVLSPDQVTPSMPLSASDIARIASLTRLQLAPDESDRLQGQINGFFELVERMRAVDTTGIAPLAHPVAAIEDITLRLRDDVVSEPDNREANQRSAPAVEAGLFLVPKVIE